MPQIPEIEVPMWRRLSSGLLVPSSIAGEVRGSAHHTHDLPPELRPPPQAVAVLDHLPSSVDQFLARPNERELGLTPSDLEYLVGETSQIPFEPAMLAISRLAAANWHIPRDRDAQLELANGFFDGAPIVHQLSRWARAEEGRVIFSEQQFFVVQRLLVEHARDGAISDGMAEEEFARLKRLTVPAIPSVSSPHWVSMPRTSLRSHRTPSHSVGRYAKDKCSTFLDPTRTTVSSFRSLRRCSSSRRREAGRPRGTRISI